MPTKNIKSTMLTVLVASMVSSQTVVGKFPFPQFSMPKSIKMPSMSDISAMFGSYVHELEMPAKEHPFTTPGTLTINNNEGNINIQEWNREAVMIKSVKKSGNQQNLANMEVQTHRTYKDGQTHLSITTAYTGEGVKGSIDHTVLVPKNTFLRVRTSTGTINVSDVTGRVVAQTTRGNIEINNTSGTLLAQTEQKGDIIVQNINGDVRAATHRGSINIKGAKNSVIASTERGKIETTFDKLSTKSRVELHAASGNVTVGLPSSTSARVHGKTENGTLTSTHYIALNSQTTLLNKNAWKEFKRTVDGRIGNLNTDAAKIHISSNNGNITILDTTTT